MKNYMFMEKVIKLPTHDRSNNYLEHIGSDKYLLNCEHRAMRQGFLDGDTFFVDPSGGPMLIVGNPLPGNEDYVIKSIMRGNEGITLTLEKRK